MDEELPPSVLLRTRAMNIRMPGEVYAKLQLISRAESRSLSNLMTVAARDLVAKWERAGRRSAAAKGS